VDQAEAATSRYIRQGGREGGRARTKNLVLHNLGIERDTREEGGRDKLLGDVHLAAGLDLGREGGREGGRLGGRVGWVYGFMRWTLWHEKAPTNASS